MVTTPKKNDIILSYSQFSIYAKCPRRWELSYIHKIKVRKPSIDAVFGTSIHETIQYWLIEYYAGNALPDYADYFLERFKENYKLEKDKGKIPFSSPEEMVQYYNDGITILDKVLEVPNPYYDNDAYELVGIEVPVEAVIDPKIPNVKLVSYLDVVLKNKYNHTIIQDIKTSNRGWRDYQKTDKLKVAQLILYKHFYVKQIDGDSDSVFIRYLIVSRNPEDGRRIEEFVPADTIQDQRRVLRNFKKFVKEVITPDGDYNTDREYPAVTGYNVENCRFCEFNTNEELCPKSKRVPI